MVGWRAWVISLCQLLGLAVSHAQGDCSGHGYKPVGVDHCDCDHPTPAVGEAGYIGTNCSTRVFGAELNAQDVTATSACRAANCSGMEALQWVCFYSALDWGADWKHLTVQLNRTSPDEDGDPDLYGMFTGGPNGQAKLPGPGTWDFREISSNRRPAVIKSVKKADISSGGYTGVYQCVKAYGLNGLTFSMRSVLTQCPAGFTDEGEQLICSSPVAAPASSQRFSECTPEGTCACKDPWKKPAGTTYEGLGFEDCSAKVEEIGQKQTGISPCGDDLLYFEGYAKWGQPPGYGWGEYDFRIRSGWGDEQSLQDLELAFDKSMDSFQTGKWYLGINAGDAGQCKVSLTISTFDCPMGCSGHGTCIKPQHANHTCQCDEGFLGVDCSFEAKALQLGKPARMAEATFAYDFQQLPDMSGLAAGHNVEVALEASWSSSKFRDWARGRPELLLLQGDNTSTAHPTNFTVKHVLEEPNTTYMYTLCPSQISEGKWRVAIYNPLSSLYPIAYNLTAEQVGHCLHNCSSRGHCQNDGTCVCDAGFAGGDCSVTSSGGSTGCTPGSRRPSHMSDKQDFTCDSPSLRRKGTADECVRDACTQDEWEARSGQACLRKCECPSDGGPCQVASSCQRDRFVCTDGYKRFSDGQPRCYRIGCTEGSLQMGSNGTVENGVSYAACICNGAEMEGQDKCGFHTEDARSYTITCNSGYTLQGAQQVRGTQASIGGKCVRAGTGSSAGAVALYILMTAAVSAALGCAGLWYYRLQSQSRMNVGGDSLYQELSPSTGF
ncbi:hypothetical protein WJX84_009959 [Apatococcus fuscideae]|uniref:EGF-like domain-containing protein n=1 Tax=Apatococcus fuscideae TaxID=2026836 RepID=A0AAW1SSG9_9CHLO